MDRRIIVALLLLPLGVFPALTGCKNSGSMGLVETETPRLPGPVASTTQRERAQSDAPLEAEGTPSIRGAGDFVRHESERRADGLPGAAYQADESNRLKYSQASRDNSIGASVAQSFSKIRSWLPFQNADREKAEEKSRAVLPAGVTPNGSAAQAGNGYEAFGADAKVAATPFAKNAPPNALQNAAAHRSKTRSDAAERPRKTPPLVQHSRRPPADPAPQPPGEQPSRTDELSAMESSPKDSAGEPDAKGLLADTIARTKPGKRGQEMGPSANGQGSGEKASDPEQTPKPAPSDGSGLKFLPPNISKKSGEQTGTDSLAAETREPSETASEGPNGKQVAGGRSEDTMPRREDMIPEREALLANQAHEEKAGEKKDKTGHNDKKQAAESPRDNQPTSESETKWVAKRQNSIEADSGETGGKEARENPSNVANSPVDAKRVVADTFATNNRSASASEGSSEAAESKATQTKSTAETASDSPAKPDANSSKKSGYVVNPHAAENKERKGSSEGRKTVARHESNKKSRLKSDQPAGSSARTSGASATGQRAMARSDRSATRRRMVGQSAASKAGQGIAQARQQRHRSRQTPVPLARSGRSFRSYYRRGVLPGATSLSSQTPTRPTRNAHASHNNTNGSAQPSTQHMAPLVDANAYRRQIASQQPRRANSGYPPGTVPQNTWLANYRKLLRQNGARSQQNPPPARSGATGRLQSTR